MKTHHSWARGVVVLIVCLVVLAAGLRRGGAAQESERAKKAIAGWRHPDAKPNSGATGAANGSIFGETFRVPHPFKDVWQFYAKKCGYVNPFPEDNQALSVSGGGSCVMMHENSTASGGGTSSTFVFHESDADVTISLVDRKDGVRVYVSAAAR